MIAYASVYAATALLKENLQTLHGTQWWCAQRLCEPQLKGMAMEISLLSDPNLAGFCTFLDKLEQKLRNNCGTSPMGVPSTPSIYETSPISNVSAPQKHSTPATVSTAIVNSFF
ncbi:hypothetical protein HDV03_004830 [Kappamyces sp. JEL0829]|nr:hypothetical protein HDV03_004830 [Kappamyces sp. JEL0829]